MSGGRKPAKRARKLPEIRLAPPRPSEAGPSARNVSWTTTIKRNEDKGHIIITESKRTREDPTPDPALQPSLQVEDVSLVEPELMAGDDFLPPSGSFEPQPSVRKRKRVNTAKSNLSQWLAFRDSTLDELLRHDGLVPNNSCAHGSEEGLFRCKDCGHGTSVCCQDCLLTKHRDLELHRIEQWNGKFFEKTSLSNLGLCIQLGHDGNTCPCPLPWASSFTVFDVSGVHQVNINYCGCHPENPLDRRVQLLRKRWFPATLIRPETAFTFDCLDTFHESTLQGKGNLYDYYHMLLRKTDNANLSATIYRFPEIHRVFRLWRNMMAWKHAGRGQDPSGIDGTPAGGVIEDCPACPHPGRNLPDNWRDAGPLLFLYALFIAVDGNFKLKGKDRKLEDVDFLGATGAFVDEGPFQEHIANYVDQPEINTCSAEHDAIVHASVRSTPGYAISGVCLVLCSRHSLVRKNGVGDMQKGEKYCNVDFIIFAALMGIMLSMLVITYDIACQWSKNLQKRMKEFPEHMRIPQTTEIRCGVPSWHIKSHGPDCQCKFNLGNMKGVGRTCGEEVETTWAHTNPLAASVREMAPVARHETLTDHWNGWNFRKVVGFRTAFLRKFKDSAAMQEKHKVVFEQFSTTFSPQTLRQWTEMVEKWEADPKAPNPYEEPVNTKTLQDIRLELATEEAAEAAHANGNVPKHKVSMTKFLTRGFELEEQQSQLREDLSKRKAKTSKQKADVLEKRNAFLRQIHIWRQAQLVYTPEVATLLATSTAVDENGSPRVDVAEHVPLFLPSALPAHVRTSPGLARVCNMEMRLRKAEANDALSDIRRGRRNITRLWRHKKVHVSGTGNRPNTRMLDVYTRLHTKVQRAAEKYRRARAALVNLDPGGAWQENLKELRKEDIRGPGKEPEGKKDKKTSNGRFEDSWIWRAARSERSAINDDEIFNDDMRVEWVKTRAWMMRWQEEYLLIQEEMRRTLAWFEWKAGWWEAQAALREVGDPSILAGVSAYTHKQADVTRRMAARCAQHWLPVLKKHGIDPEWASKYGAKDTRPVREREQGDKEVVEDDEGLGAREVPSDEEDSDEGEDVDDYFDLDM